MFFFLDFQFRLLTLNKQCLNKLGVFADNFRLNSKQQQWCKIWKSTTGMTKDLLICLFFCLRCSQFFIRFYRTKSVFMLRINFLLVELWIFDLQMEAKIHWGLSLLISFSLYCRSKLVTFKTQVSLLVLQSKNCLKEVKIFWRKRYLKRQIFKFFWNIHKLRQDNWLRLHRKNTKS